MSCSQPVLNAISNLCNQVIHYVAEIKIEKDLFLICLGNNSIILFDDQLKEKEAEIHYYQILRVIVDPENQDLFQIDLNEHRQEGLDESLVILSPTRETKQIIQMFQVLWKTNFNLKIQRVGKFPVFKTNLLRWNKGKNNIFRKFAVPEELFNPPSGYIDYNLNGYKFFLPQEFDDDEKEIGLFLNKYKQNEFIYVQINSVILLDYYTQLLDYINLEHYCFQYGRKILQQYPYKIIHSGPYLKRTNMNMDKASWRGWEIHYRNQKQDVFLILLRRKYIPPTCESFQDFIICMHGKPRTPEEIDKFLTKNYNAKQFPDTQKNLKIVRDCADSIQTMAQIDEINYLIIQAKSSSLVFNEMDNHYFENTLQIRPQGFIYALSYATSVFRHLSQKHSEFTKLIQALMDKYKDIIKLPMNKALFQELKNITQPSEIIERFKSSSVIKDSKSIKDTLQTNWRFKITKYIGYCLNGGLLHEQFQIKDILILMNKIGSDHPNYPYLYNLLDMFLYLTIDSEEQIFEKLEVKVNKLLQRPNVNVVYHQKIMEDLIKYKFINNELILKSQPRLYVQFFDMIFKKYVSIQIRINYCQCIKEYCPLEINPLIDQTLELGVLKGSVTHIFRFFQEENVQVKIQAAYALIVLFKLKKEYINMVFSENKAYVFKEAIELQSNPLNEAVLLLVCNLKTAPQALQKLAEEKYLEAICVLIQQTQIYGVHSTNQQITNVVIFFFIENQIYHNTRKLIKNNQNLDIVSIYKFISIYFIQFANINTFLENSSIYLDILQQYINTFQYIFDRKLKDYPVDVSNKIYSLQLIKKIISYKEEFLSQFVDNQWLSNLIEQILDYSNMDIVNEIIDICYFILKNDQQSSKLINQKYFRVFQHFNKITQDAIMKEKLTFMVEFYYKDFS